MFWEASGRPTRGASRVFSLPVWKPAAFLKRPTLCQRADGLAVPNIGERGRRRRPRLAPPVPISGPVYLHAFPCATHTKRTPLRRSVAISIPHPERLVYTFFADREKFLPFRAPAATIRPWMTNYPRLSAESAPQFLQPAAAARAAARRPDAQAPR